MTLKPSDSIDLHTLAERYQSGKASPADLISEVLDRIDAYPDKAVWIDRLSRDEVMAQAERATDRRQRGIAQPLYGIPFTVKDNIDVAGRVTTAGCPDFAYRATKSAAVVEKLMDAGAILLGKTNLDQFATGLVGTRSPYGVCRNPFDARYIPGGSSSGSAVAVAAGLVSFSLGTDTAGSGRVPAAFNNLVGLKPTRGVVSAAGVVPACQSLDCVSIFALTTTDAVAVFDVVRGFDVDDPYAREADEIPTIRQTFPAPFRFGIPADEALRFYGNAEAEALYRRAIERLKSLGGAPETIDYQPFVEAAELLYDGPWLAERLAGLRDFLADRPEGFLPVTRNIISAARRFDAVAAFEGLHALRALRRRARRQLEKVDLFLLPTTGTIYTIDEVEADPVTLNTRLGYYTNFVNLLDMAAVAVPSGFQSNGLPAGVSLLAPAGNDSALLELAGRYHRAMDLTLGATGCPMPAAPPAAPSAASGVRLAVVGAHLSGQPLNHQLTQPGGWLVRTCRTAPSYRLFALPGTTPPKPGLIHCEKGTTGAAIEVEVWELSAEAFGRFVAAIPPPLGIGTVMLEDGESVKGFVCESYAVAGARDISSFGGWRKFLQERT